MQQMHGLSPTFGDYLIAVGAQIYSGTQEENGGD